MQTTIDPCFLCGAASVMTIEIEAGRVRFDVRGRVIAQAARVRPVCVDCHAGILAHRAEEVGRLADQHLAEAKADQLRLW